MRSRASARTRRKPSSAVRPAPEAAPADAARAKEYVCVYAVVSGASGPLRVSGASGERLRRIRLGGLDLVIGIIPRVPRPTPAAMRRYDATMRDLMEVHGSILPARFGTCTLTLEELASATRDRSQALRRALRVVRHRVQMTIRVFAPGSDQGRTRVGSGSDRDRTGVGPGSDRGRIGVGSGSDPGPAAVRGRQYLQRRAAELQISGTEPLRAAVRKWVRAERTERHDRGRLAGSLYHLVPRGATATYRETLRRAALTAGVTIVISGPWPPYAFAEGGW